MPQDNSVNDTRFADLSKKVTQLGKDAADGQDALPRLGFAVVTAAHDGAIDDEKNKHGDDDDTTVIYAAYLKGQGKKQFSDYGADGTKANVSKLRQLTKLGMNPHCDPNDVLVRTVEARDNQAAAKNKVLAAYPAMVSVARKQNELDRAITDDEIAEAVLKPAPATPELTKVIQGLANTLEKIISGEHRAGQSQDEKVIAAFESLSSFVTLIAAKSERDELMAKVAAMGLTVTPMPTMTPEVTEVTSAGNDDSEAVLSYVNEGGAQMELV